ncbi:Hypothetical predicted protein [Xyrichtys novacula]|uniref:Transmembrane protein n=1 Tax=Xyrichtys novacula TaxID=13765 RepID=A0AAV1GBF0_XYRNO|nr:Hypothetical predicted protein [Xyrichtys novacula]
MGARHANEEFAPAGSECQVVKDGVRICEAVCSCREDLRFLPLLLLTLQAPHIFRSPFASGLREDDGARLKKQRRVKCGVWRGLLFFVLWTTFLPSLFFSPPLPITDCPSLG